MNEVFVRFKSLNWFFVALVFFLSFVGFVMIYSATSGMEYDILFSHILKIFFGFLLMLLVGIIDIDFWKKNAFYFYILCLILLFWASLYGYIGKGSRRWINFYGFFFQPSELMKICIILALAKFFDEKKNKGYKRLFFFNTPNYDGSDSIFFDFIST